MEYLTARLKESISLNQYEETCEYLSSNFRNLYYTWYWVLSHHVTEVRFFCHSFIYFISGRYLLINVRSQILETMNLYFSDMSA